MTADLPELLAGSSHALKARLANSPVSSQGGQDPSTRPAQAPVLQAPADPVHPADALVSAHGPDSAPQGPEALAEHDPVVPAERRLPAKLRVRNVPQTIAAVAVASSIRRRRKAQ